MEHLTFFMGEQPDKEAPNFYPRFSYVYPYPTSTNYGGKLVTNPVVSAVTSKGKGTMSYGIYIDHKKELEIDIPLEFHYNPILYHMYLEEELLKLIKQGIIPADAWIRIH